MKIFNVRYAILIVIMTTSCAVIQKKENFSNPSFGDYKEKTKIVLLTKNIFGNFLSSKKDVIESENIFGQDKIKLLEEAGFELTDQKTASYSINCTLILNESNYTPKNDPPFNYMFRYGWAMISVMSVGIVPFYNHIERSFTLEVTNNNTNKKLTYEIENSYDMWISIFMLPYSTLKKPAELINEKSLIEFRYLLKKIKNDIDEMKI